MKRLPPFIRSAASWSPLVITGATLWLPFSLGLILSSDESPASEPSWWHETPAASARLVDPLKASDSRQVANLGQAKYMRLRAHQALGEVAPGLAAELDPMLIPEPAAKDSSWYEAQKAPVNLGQLKQLSAPFYELLQQRAPEWLRG